MAQPLQPASILIGFAGTFGAGKDTAINAICGHSPTCVRKAFADPVYEAAFALNPIITYRRRWLFKFEPVRLQTLVGKHGWDSVKRTYPEARRTLQRLGTEVGRQLWGSRFWVDRLFAEWRPGTPTLISGVRFPEEVAAIKARGGEIWLIERPAQKLEAEHIHSSEHVMDRSQCDRTLVNTDVASFKKLALATFQQYLCDRRKAHDNTVSK